MAEVQTDADSLVLWEKATAGRLVGARLLGNGRLGAVVFGTSPDDPIVTTGDTVWSGGESFLLNSDNRSPLPEAHGLVTERMLGGWGQASELPGRTAQCSQGR